MYKALSLADPHLVSVSAATAATPCFLTTATVVMFARLLALASEAAPASVAPETVAALKKYRRGARTGQAPLDGWQGMGPRRRSPAGNNALLAGP